MYDAGQFFESVVIKQLSTTSDNTGGVTNTYTTLASLRAKVDRLRQVQSENDGNITLGQEVDIIVRYKSVTLTYNDKYVVEWDSKVWVVNSFVQEGTRGLFLRLNCWNEY